MPPDAAERRPGGGGVPDGHGGNVLLTVPDVTGMDTLTAALAYAKAGWYVGPVKRGTKNPGSVLGSNWQQHTSRDPKMIIAWLALAGDGIFLHAGRSGAVIIDVDNIPGLADCPPLVAAIGAHIKAGRPVQSTGPGRGHYVFTQPAGRMLGNGKGKLTGNWGEIRGRNGVILAAPTPHPEGREYKWIATGPVPELPGELAALLPDAAEAADAATDAEVEAFLSSHTASWQPHRLELTVADLEKRINAGESRHDTAVVKLTLAFKEAARGMFAAREAARRIGEVFTAAACRDLGDDRRTRDKNTARDEYAGIVAWAVAQAATVSPQSRQFRQSSDDGETGETWRDSSGGAQVVRLADVRPERIDWLWEGRLPLGKIVILDGDPGVGKSSLTTDWAATVSTGKPWPDGSPCPDGEVLILSAEDGLSDTIRPRLDAAGADPGRIHALTAVAYTDAEGAGHDRPPVIPADLALIKHIVRDRGVRLVIIDVLMAYLSGEVNSYRDQDVRRALHTVATLAAETGACVVILRHLNKSSGTNALYRGGGSIGIVGQARAAFIAAADPDDDTGQRRILAAAKMNIALKPPALAYQLVPDAGRGCARVEWLGETAHAAGDLLAERTSPDDADDRTERDEAAEWLRAYLTDNGGEAAPGDAKKAAREAGIAIRTLERARVRAGVRLRRGGFPAKTLWVLEP
jgi:AAA domain-containing protein/bifunctional DNA primase/polymerase-like protein